MSHIHKVLRAECVEMVANFGNVFIRRLEMEGYKLNEMSSYKRPNNCKEQILLQTIFHSLEIRNT